MWINERIVIDMASGEVLEAEGFDYGGPVALCMGSGSGGGSQTTNTQDTEYNARMATIAEQQQGMAQEYFDFWKSDYQPLEQEQIAANREMIAAAKPVRDKFIEESLNGVNADAIAGTARADAEQAVTTAEQGSVRNMSRLGLNPSSGAFQDALAGTQALTRARAVTQSANTARALARSENYDRLTKASSLGMG